MVLQGNALCIFLTITCGLSYLLYGYDQGMMMNEPPPYLPSLH